MLRRRLAGKIVAVVLISALHWAALPAATPPSTGSIAGHVLSADSQAPLAGVQVHLADSRTGEIRTSSPTSADGSFSVAGLQPSSYELAVQSAGGVYLADGALRLDSGQKRNVQVAINAQIAPSPAEKSSGRRRGAGWWNNPLAATLIVLGSAVLVGVAVDQLTNDDDDAAQPASSSSR